MNILSVYEMTALVNGINTYSEEKEKTRINIFIDGDAFRFEAGRKGVSVIDEDYERELEETTKMADFLNSYGLHFEPWTSEDVPKKDFERLNKNVRKALLEGDKKKFETVLKLNLEKY